MLCLDGFLINLLRKAGELSVGIGRTQTLVTFSTNTKVETFLFRFLPSP